jgi:MSHA biogenesis protein MshQ
MDAGAMSRPAERPGCALRLALRRLLAAGLLACLPAVPVQAVTVTKTPVASSNCTSAATGGTRSWSRASRAFANDNSNATASVDGTTTRYLQCLNYGFSIPTGAVINGIAVAVARKANSTANGGSRDAFMRIVKSGTIGSTDRATATLYTTSEVSESHGGSADLWGLSWTAADINAANFGAAFAATKASSAGSSHTISVDVIAITVDYSVDTTPPTVSALARASLNPASGSTVTWTVTFSESVTGVDASDFALVGSGVSGAAITSVSGSGTTWSVNASTGSGSGSLALNLVDNDSIVDGAGNRLGGTGSGNGNNAGEVYTIDKSNPNALSLVRTNSNPSNVATLSWTVTFNEAVTGVDTGDFVLVGTGSAAGSISLVTGVGTGWAVTATGVTGNGTLGLNLVDNDSIVDLTLNKLGGAGSGNGNQTGEVYSVDRVAPAVLSINRDSATPSTLNEISWTVIFSESVTGVTADDFVLISSGLAGAAVTSLSGSGATWTVTADPGYGSGSGTIGLNLVDDDSIVDAVGNALGGTGTGNGNFSGQIYTVSTPPLASYRFEEAAWNGSTDQVSDEQADNPGTARNGATTAATTPAQGGTPGTCRYGVFTSTASPPVSNGYVDLGIGFPYQTDSFTVTGWVRSSANGSSNQWIFSHNTGGSGYALSLGTAGAGRLRFASGGAATVNLDSPATAASLLANDTWYFVAAVADFATAPAIVRKLYVFDSSGTLLPGYPVSLSSTGWGETEAGAASIGGNGSSSFRGWLDDIQIFDKALNPQALSLLVQTSHTCSTVVPDHYEMALAANSLSCMATPVIVTACADASSPCTNPYTGAGGTTAALATSAGNLAATTLTFDGGGTASTLLSHPSAADGTVVSLTLSGEAITASNGRRCCPNGTSCAAASSCTSTFNTAGFIVAAATGGTAVAVPAQTAGTSSGGFVLRAVKTGTSTQACEAALTGITSVNWAAQCNNPTTCSSGNRMTLTSAGTSTVASNPNSGVSSSTPVTMSFDANGHAPFSFNYADVGQVTLWASKVVNGASLSGSSNAFVVKPAGFSITAVQQTASPNLANPAAASASGSKFVQAGEAFSATVTALTSSGATAPSFGRETSPESVLLTPNLVLPSGGSAGSLSNANIPGGRFSNGVATVSTLSYSEVGIITLTPSVASGSYLGAGAVTGATSSNVGRFVPARFALSGGSVAHRSALSCSPASSFSYLGENFRLAFTLTAQNAAGGTTQNYTGSFAKLDPTAAGGWNLAGLAGTTRFSNTSGRLSLGSATGAFSGGSVAVSLTANATRASSPDGPFTAAFGVAPSDSDGVALGSLDMASTSGGSNDRGTVASVALRHGRLRLSSAAGAADRALALPAAAQSWTGSAWDINTGDSCTTVAASAVNFGNPRRTLTLADLNVSGPISISSGQGTLRLAAPGGGRSGTVDVALSLGSSSTDASCLQSWTPTKAATTAANQPYLRGAWCGSSTDKDPAARASFGLQRTQDQTVYRREMY